MKLSLPNSKIAEQVIISHILTNKPKFEIIFNRVSIDMFYFNEYKDIYEVASDLYKRNIEINFDTVYSNLDVIEGYKTADYNFVLTELINKSVTAVDLETYLILLLDKYLRRNLILSVNNVSKLAYDNSLSLENIFDQAEQLLLNVTQKKPNLGLLPASEVLLETFIELEKRSKSGHLAGISSGFFDLDLLTQGFQKSDLIIIAGRPSMGKTAFALNIARNVSDLQDYPVVIFSLEMSRSQIIYRFLSSESSISNSKLRSGIINTNEWRSVSKAISSLSDLNIYIDDKSDITISDIRVKLGSLKSRFGYIGLVIIDYLQLISDSKSQDSRVQELSRITRSLKLLAKEFNVPVIVLSQLSRSVESRTNKRPLLSDLRESGCFSRSTNLYYSFQVTKRISSSLQFNQKNLSLIGIRQRKNVLSFSTSRLKSVFPTGYHFIYRLFAIGHRYIKLTYNHKVLTQNGWKKVDNLSSLDLISTIDKHNFLEFSNCYFYIDMLSSLTFLSITMISFSKKEIVYDCWLPSTNNFVGNGYVLHNSIEQDADLVLMLYREQYYNELQKENTTDLTIAKHRNGPVGTINLIFDSNTASFGNIIN
jgi:replicative DNA helicase